MRADAPVAEESMEASRVMMSFTRDDLRAELTQLSEAVQSELKQVVAHIQMGVRHELQQALLDGGSLPPTVCPLAPDSIMVLNERLPVQQISTSCFRSPNSRQGAAHSRNGTPPDRKPSGTLPTTGAAAHQNGCSEHHHETQEDSPTASPIARSSLGCVNSVKDEVERCKKRLTRRDSGGHEQDVFSPVMPGSRAGGVKEAERQGASTLRDFVESGEFDAIMAINVLVNAAVIGLQADYTSRHVTDELPVFYTVMDAVCNVVLIIEVTMRLISERCLFFYGINRRWNLFDLMVIFSQLFEFFAQSEGMGDVVRSVRILRLTRVFRIVRILRLMSELRTIVSSIYGSLRHVCWTLLLLLLLIYSLGVFLTQMTGNRALSLKESLGQKLEPELQKHFGSLGDSVLTLYQAITGGVDWGEVATPLAKFISPGMNLAMSFYVAFVMFAILNSVTGIFVETAARTAKKDRDSFVCELAQKVLMKAELDEHGQITWETFQNCLNFQEMKMYFEAMELDINDAVALFDILDVEKSGVIGPEEFMNGAFRLRGSCKAIEFAVFLMDYTHHSRTLDARCQEIQVLLQSLVQTADGHDSPCPSFRSPAVDFCVKPNGEALRHSRSFVESSADTINTANDESKDAAEKVTKVQYNIFTSTDLDTSADDAQFYVPDDDPEQKLQL